MTAGLLHNAGDPLAIRRIFGNKALAPNAVSLVELAFSQHLVDT